MPSPPAKPLGKSAGNKLRLPPAATPLLTPPHEPSQRSQRSHRKGGKKSPQKRAVKLEAVMVEIEEEESEPDKLVAVKSLAPSADGTVSLVLEVVAPAGPSTDALLAMVSHRARSAAPAAAAASVFSSLQTEALQKANARIAALEEEVRLLREENAGHVVRLFAWRQLADQQQAQPRPSASSTASRNSGTQRGWRRSSRDGAALE